MLLSSSPTPFVPKLTQNKTKSNSKQFPNFSLFLQFSFVPQNRSSLSTSDLPNRPGRVLPLRRRRPCCRRAVAVSGLSRRPAASATPPPHTPVAGAALSLTSLTSLFYPSLSRILGCCRSRARSRSPSSSFSNTGLKHIRSKIRFCIFVTAALLRIEEHGGIATNGGKQEAGKKGEGEERSKARHVIQKGVPKKYKHTKSKTRNMK